MVVVARVVRGVLVLGSLTGCGQTSNGPAEPPHRDAECEAIADAIAQEMEPGYCTAVLRFAFETNEPRGHAFVCSPVASHPTEDEARERANAEVVYDMEPDVKAGEGELASGAGPESQWVFFKSPLDFGGVAVVSAVTGEPVFGGSIVWAGTGKIAMPEKWSTADLGSGCADSESPLPVTRIELGLSSMFGEFDSSAVEAAGVGSVLPRIWGSFRGALDGATLLVYPRSVGTFAPSQAEYVLFIEGHSAGG